MDIHRDETSFDHRQTAADWHGGQASALYAYASTGTVAIGITTEIFQCLADVKRGAVDSETDVVQEHARLSALLAVVQPEAGHQIARSSGYQEGRWAAACWQDKVIGGAGGYSASESEAVARQVLRGIEGEDPAILDNFPDLPAPWTDDLTPAYLSRHCDWPEPDLDDAESHKRWAEAQSTLREAYEAGFAEGVHDGITVACREELSSELGGNPNPTAFEAALNRVQQSSPRPTDLGLQ